MPSVRVAPIFCQYSRCLSRKTEVSTCIWASLWDLGNIKTYGYSYHLKTCMHRGDRSPPSISPLCVWAAYALVRLPISTGLPQSWFLAYDICTKISLTVSINENKWLLLCETVLFLMYLYRTTETSNIKIVLIKPLYDVELSDIKHPWSWQKIAIHEVWKGSFLYIIKTSF